MSEDNKKSFEQAGQEEQVSLVSEFFQMLRQNKKFWMIPLVLILIVLGLIVLAGPAVAPWIYTLF